MKNNKNHLGHRASALRCHFTGELWKQIPPQTQETKASSTQKSGASI